jgi:hypothetical protein
LEREFSLNELQSDFGGGRAFEVATVWWSVARPFRFRMGEAES